MLLAVIADEVLSLLFAALVLGAVAMSAVGWHLAKTRTTLTVVGLLAGFMGTVSGIGGPPIALVYQHAAGPKLRATLNTYFALGSLVSIPVLVAADAFTVKHALMGLALLPAVAFGFYCSRFTRDRFDGPRLRPAVLWLAALSSFAVVVRALLR